MKDLMNIKHFTTSLRASPGCVVLAVALVGCGGGGGGEAPVIPAAALPTANLQGIWTGTIGSDAASAVVLSDGKAWLIANSAPIKLYTAALQGGSTSYSASGKQYTSGVAGAVNIAVVTTSVSSKATLSGNVTPTGGVATAYNFSYESRYEVPATLAALSGTWRGTQAGGNLVVEWLINAAGALSQTSNNSNGCSYSGNVAVHNLPSPVGVYDLSLRESCTALGTTKVKDFQGIATLDTSNSKATFAFSRSDAGFEGTEAFVQPTTKQ
jgi:hypothetical protein